MGTERFNEAVKRSMHWAWLAPRATGLCVHRTWLFILSSPLVIGVSADVFRAYVRMRELAATHDDLAERLAELEDKTEALAINHDNFSRNARNPLKEVCDTLRELMTPPGPPNRPIGFNNPEDKDKKSSSQAKRKI